MSGSRDSNAKELNGIATAGSGGPSSPVPPKRSYPAPVRVSTGSTSAKGNKYTPIKKQKITRESRRDKPNYEGNKTSLSKLAKDFMESFANKPVAPVEGPAPEGSTLSIDDCSGALNVHKRRIYDIINILESVQIVTRAKKGTYRWHGPDNLPVFFARVQQDCFKADANEARKNGILTDDTYICQNAPSDDNTEKKKGKILVKISTDFIRLFLLGNVTIGLDEVSDRVFGTKSEPCTGKGGPKEDEANLKTEGGPKSNIRRFYDVANILEGIGIVEKNNFNTRPYFKWTFHVAPKDMPVLISAKEQVCGTVPSLDISKHSLPAKSLRDDVADELLLADLSLTNEDKNVESPNEAQSSLKQKSETDVAYKDNPSEGSAKKSKGNGPMKDPVLDSDKGSGTQGKKSTKADIDERLSQPQQISSILSVDDNDSRLSSNKPRAKKMHSSQGNALVDYLNSAEPHISSALLRHSAAFQHEHLDSFRAKKIFGTMMTGPQSNHTYFQDPNRMQHAYDCSRTFIATSEKVEKSNGVPAFGPSSWDDVERCLEQPVKGTDSMKSFSSIKASKAIHRLGAALQHAASGLSCIEEILKSELRPAKEEGTPPSPRNLYTNKPTVRIILGVGIREALKRAVRCAVRCWVRHGHLLIGDGDDIEPADSADADWCSMEAKRCLDCLGSIVSHLAWVFCAEEAIDMSSNDCSFAVEGALTIELTRAFQAENDYGLLHRPENPSNAWEKFSKRAKIWFILSLDKSFATPLQKNLAKKLNLFKDMKLSCAW